MKLKRSRLRRVQAHVDPVQPARLQALGPRGQQRAVRGHRDVPQGRKRPENVLEILAQQRLSAGKLDLVDAVLRGDAGDLRHLGHGDLAAALRLALAVAVDATQVAPVGQRDAQATEILRPYAVNKKILHRITIAKSLIINFM